MLLYDDLNVAWPLFSANCHWGHFGEAFGLSIHDCEVAQSA